MTYFKWIIFCLIDWAMLPVHYALAPLLSLFTGRGWPKWGGWFWTYDNPPQGDGGFQVKRAPYINASSPWQLYVNRVFWLWRNPLYGLQKAFSVRHGSDVIVKLIRFGGSGVDTSDKYRRAGWYYAECLDDFEYLIAFELYAVIPWSSTRCLRLRLGWKIVTDKFERLGFAPLVDTFNPLDGYGDE
jgi:hypothetical protein